MLWVEETVVSFEDVASAFATGVDAVGIAIIVTGSLASLVWYGWRIVTRSAAAEAYGELRRAVGKAILLGLEFLVAADIIRTVAISPTFRGVGVLAVIVLIRSFLSATLEMEIEGHWPWQRSDRVGRAERPQAGASAPSARPD